MLPLSECLHISFCGLYHVVSTKFPWGKGPIASSMPIIDTLIQFLPTMFRLQISYAWYIHSQCEHGCDLNFRQITLDLLCSTLSIFGRYLNINNVYFDNMVSLIYPSELQLNKANASDTEAAF